MKVIYSHHFNINLGLLNHLHPFDGLKFQRIHKELSSIPDIEWVSPHAPIDMAIIDSFVTDVMRYRIRNKNGILQALEVPKIPFIGLKFLDKKILNPMRWGVAGTLYGAENALDNNEIYWNLSGGYHHATPQNMEGFCIYNDIGIAYQQLIESGKLNSNDKVLIIDTDAHHGNGNAYTFMENPNVTLLDVYNAGIYPTSNYSRERVDIPVPLMPGTEGKTYLEKYQTALDTLGSHYKIAFVVAGTDVLTSDRLGKLHLTTNDVSQREKMTINKLKELGIPAVLTGGGGYSSDSAKAVIKAIAGCANLEPK